MCLAVPGRLIECEGGDAVVDMQGNRVRIVRVLTPEARPGDWVLVHAGFSISMMDEKTALTTWEYLNGAYGVEELKEEISATKEGKT